MIDEAKNVVLVGLRRGFSTKYIEKLQSQHVNLFFSHSLVNFYIHKLQFSGFYFDTSATVLSLIIGISSIVWMIGVWFSYRTSTKNIIVRSVLFLCCILSVDALVLQPKYNKKQISSTAVLFTHQKDIDHFNAEQWKDKNYTFFKLPQIKSTSKDSLLIKTVANVDHLIHHYQPIDQIYIVGDHLSIIAFKNLPEVPIQFLPSVAKELNNLLSIEYTKNLKVNEYFELFIKLELDSSIQKYTLQSPFIQLDTIEITEKPLTIEHKAICAIPGNHLVELHFLNTDNAIVETVALPLEVIPNQKASILMLNGYPGFEHNHLKNYLAKQGHQLKVKTQTSLQNFQFDQINVKEKSKAFVFNKTLLKNIDLLIVDGTSLLALNESAYQLIKQFHKNGMAILLRTDENILKAASKLADFKIDIEQIAQSQKMFAKVLIDKQPTEIDIYPYQNNLFTSKRFKGKDAGKILSTNRNVYQLFGITNLQNSYLFNLKGDSLTYNHLWFGMIDEMLGVKNVVENTWQFKTVFPISGEAIKLILLSNETQPAAFFKSPETVENNWSALHLLQHYLISEQYEATFWANQAGWYQFKTGKDSSFAELYVSGSHQNKLIKRYNESRLKAKYIDLVEERHTADYKAQHIYIKKLIPPIWNWLIFIICLSTIWILEKFFN